MVYPVVEPLIVAPVGWQSVASASLLELLTGAVLGYLAAMIVAGARMAGELVAAQAGLSTSTLLDPETGEEIGPLGRLYGWIAVVAFLGLGGPMILVKALVESYEAVPAGGLLISAETARWPLRRWAARSSWRFGRRRRSRWRWLWLESSWDGSAARPRRFRLSRWRCRSARWSASCCLLLSLVARLLRDAFGCLGRRIPGEGEADVRDRTQPPSKRRRQMARQQGQAAHSPELTAAVGWLAAVVVLGFVGR